MTTTTTRLLTSCAAAALALGLAACGGAATPSAATAPASPAAAAEPTDSDDDTAAGDDDTAAADAQVSANTASEKEIAAALESAGVSNADRWAEEVVEYRPYPTDDPNLAKLRDNLAKYNPGEETTDKIVSTLTP